MKTVLNVKTDKNLKIKAQKVAKELGLPLGTIINNYLGTLVREKRVIFSIERELSQKKKKLYGQIQKDIRTGKNIKGPFKTIGDMDRYLDSIK